MKPEEVYLSPSPWVSFGQLVSSLGTVVATVAIEEDLDSALTALCYDAQVQTLNRGGNVILGYEISVDPFETHNFCLVGTAASVVWPSND